MKRRIRLTESDLHRIVKESVDRILKESQLLTELHPLTLDSYARKRAAQGQKEKAEQGRQAAVDAWNREYGYDGTDPEHPYMKVPNEYGSTTIKMANYPNEYTVHNQIKYGDDDEHYDIHYATYDPERDYTWTTDSRHKAYDTQGRGYNPMRYLGVDRRGTHHYKKLPISDKLKKGYEVARQMAQGNGKYIKGQGWQ